MNLGELVGRLTTHVVGRRREIDLVVAALAADRHIVLEGPPGTGKSTLLRSVAAELGIGFEFVEGNAELTPARLIGHFDPARVLAEGYDPSVFVDGPVVTALRDGSLLYIEELNRVPEETLNVLVTVMSEREINVPRLGRITAAPGFRLVAAMNPFDAVGTARISGAISDRVCRLAVDYQDEPDELAITQRHGSKVTEDFMAKAVALVRKTRDHPDLRSGSSVRGSIDLSAVAATLAEVRNSYPEDPNVSLDAALIGLSGRVKVREGSGRTPEEVVTELWEEVFQPKDEDASDDLGKENAPKGATPAD